MTQERATTQTNEVSRLGWATILSALLLASGPWSPASAQAPAPACSLLSKNGDQYAQIQMPGFDPSNRSIPLSPPKPEENATAVICRRDTIVPAPTDYRILTEMHLPLAIKVGQLTLWLVIDHGQLKVLTPADGTSPEDSQALQARLNEMQSAIQTRHSAP